jgi:hypothetical protein
MPQERKLKKKINKKKKKILFRSPIREIICEHFLLLLETRSFDPNLSLEGVVLLRQVLLPEVGGIVSASVAPFEHLLSRDVGVLEVVVLGVGSVGPWPRDGNRTLWQREGVGVGRRSDQ